MTNEDFPKRGFNFVTPSIVERQLTGWCGTAQFERLGHRYAIKWIVGRPVECSRDDKPIAWHKMNYHAQRTAHKAHDFLKSALAVAAAN